MRLTKPPKKKPLPPDTQFMMVISKPGRKAYRIEAWRYYSIMDLLRWWGVERQEAEDAAKHCCRAKDPHTFNIGDITIEIKIIEKEKRKHGNQETQRDELL